MKTIVIGLLALLIGGSAAQAADGHDNLREQSSFSKSISGQILGKYAQKAKYDRADAKLTGGARARLIKARAYSGKVSSPGGSWMSEHTKD